jgi:hypothetical protein
MAVSFLDEETGEITDTPPTRRAARAAERAEEPETPAKRERKPFDYKRGFWIAVAIFGLYVMGTNDSEPQQAAPAPVQAPASVSTGVTP